MSRHGPPRALFSALLAAAGVAGPSLWTSALAGAQPAGTTAQGIGIGLLEAPVSRADDPRARIYIVDHVAPGTAFTRRFRVVNRTPAPVTLQLYADSARITGGSFLPDPGRAASDLTSWITIDPGQLTLQPGQEGTAQARFAVPADATSGERYGVLMAELPPAPGPGITESARVGIRVYLSVGPGGEPASDFTITSLTAGRLADRAPVVLARVRNTGGRALDLSGSLKLEDGPGGLSAGPYPTANGITLAIGAAQPIEVRLDPRLPDGPWTAAITLHSGVVERTARATIRFPSRAGTVGLPVTSGPPGGIPVLPLAVGLPAALALIFLGLLWRRARRPSRREGDPDLPCR